MTEMHGAVVPSTTERRSLQTEHTHWFISGQMRCAGCGMSLPDVRTEGAYRMMAEAFDRLAAVLERLEKKL